CDRWSSALQAMGVGQGDRVAYIAPNTREQLESFYAVPQIGAVLVPINYRLTAEDFVYITSHSGAKVLCVHPDYVETVEGVRDQLHGVEQFVVLGDAGGRKGWREHDAEVARAKPSFKRVDVKEDDLLSLNYTRGAARRGDYRAHGGRVRLGGNAGLRPDRDVALPHDLRAAPRACLQVDIRARRDQGPDGRRDDRRLRAARGRRRRQGCSGRRPNAGRDRGSRQRDHAGVLQRP